MADYPIVKIGDVCRIEKGQTGIQNAMPGEYPLVTTGPERKSADSYQFDIEAVCIPLVSSSGHGKKSLNYVHYQEGKFALGTILAAIIPNDSQQLNAAFLQQYLQFFKDTKLVTLMKGAANVSLSMRDIAQIEVPLPPIDRQNKFISIFNRATVFSEQLLREFDTQLAYIAQLRQTILQEAIEGKLTTQWRAQHRLASTGSASSDPEFDAMALLAQIKAEKQKLIAEKKIAKVNHLSPISEAEMPFELPEGWVWCRLGEIGSNFAYGTSTKSTPEGKVPVLRMGNLQNGAIIWDSLVYSNDNDEIAQYLLKKGDLLFNRTNSRELVGKTALFDSERQAIFAGYLVKFSMLGAIAETYINYLMNSTFHREWCNEVRTDALGQSNINATKLREFRVPLPPLAEQRAIVERVDRLLTLVDELAAQVTERKAQADALMQAVLREAFAE